MSTLPYSAAELPVTLAPELPARVGRGWLLFWALFVTAAYALLWTSDWYPLSDSSLYLSVARSIAEGRGITMMGESVLLTPPFAPYVIALVMKLGGGVGTIQAVMIGLMLAGHAFCFCALRRIFDERLALGATVAAACSYWVYANAFTVMSEPPAVAAMWAGVWALTTTRAGEDATRRRVKVAATAALFVAAAATRDAVIVLLPGFLLLLPGALRPAFVLVIGGAIVALITVGVMLPYKAMRGTLGNEAYAYAALVPVAVGLAVLLGKRRDLVTRAFDKLRLPAQRVETFGQIAVVVALLAAWLGVYRYPPSFLARPVVTRQLAATAPAGTNPSTLPAVDQAPAVAAISTGEGDDDTATSEGRYKAKWLYGVKRDAWHLTTEPPLLAGRWITEGLAMPSVAVFESKMQAIASVGKAVGFVAFALSVAGLVVLLRRGHWWLMGPALYFAAIWLQWGTRIKPRYMVPI
ncbi:MAG TPA: hypothetical protein VEA69_24560, partial [Tepidisphaeraceae bacterium]|nr:hypothetical protein [Tepidisphaeraceae bacterium]